MSDRASTAAAIGGLVLANAMIFQEELARHHPKVKPLARVMSAPDPIAALATHWEHILTIDYIPIFKVAHEILLAIPADYAVEHALRYLANRARAIAARRAALRHDLMGRVYHRLLVEAKYLGTYYTSVPAATLLLKLALQEGEWPLRWHDLDDIRQLRIADLACGTGTLLMAAVQAIVDNYVQAASHEGHSLNLGSLHQVLIEEVIWGYDVLPSALHLTASTLALLAPEVVFQHMSLYNLPLGGVHHRLGSIEFLSGNEVHIERDLFEAVPQPEAVTATKIGEAQATLPRLDLCAMNPPFTRSVGGNLLFGSVPQPQRRAMQKELATLLRRRNAEASSTAGLGAVFVAVADRHIKDGGRIALVLPKGVLSGVAWERTRRLLAATYHLEYIITSYEPDHWNFSENTNLSEVLLVAQKHPPGQTAGDSTVTTTAVNLWQNPRTPIEALTVADLICQAAPSDITREAGSAPLHTDSRQFGEVLRVPWAWLRDHPSLWLLPGAFAQTDLARIAFGMLQGRLALPGSSQVYPVPLRPLGKLGTLGPDRRDVYDGFQFAPHQSAFPAFWGIAADRVTTLAQQPNRYLTPLSRARRGRPLRRATVLWPRAGRLLLAERLRLNTQRLTSVHLPARVLSNVWWPMALHNDDKELALLQEQALTLWLNSTLGLLVLLVHREETEGAWVQFKKPSLTHMPVPDVQALSSEQLVALGTAYDRLSTQPLQPFPALAQDAVRQAIDDTFSTVLSLPDLTPLRRLLAQEPFVCLQPLPTELP